MDVRGKLVELIVWIEDQMTKAYPYTTDQFRIETTVDHLIANGVTVQEWIPVNDERKPKEGEDVLVAVFDGYDTYTDIDCLMRDGKWCFETENYKVTHWMEKPQPPKGE